MLRKLALATVAAILIPSALAHAQAKVVPTVIRGGAVLARVTVNTYKAYMQVDTGATTSVIDARIARQIHLPAQGKPVTGRAVGCTASATPVDSMQWSVGSVALPEASISAVRTPGKLPIVRGLKVIGLIGNDALRGFGDVGFDFVDDRLVLGGSYPDSGREMDAGALVDPKTDAVALFTAKVKFGRRSAVFGVDTGAGATVIDSVAARKLKLRRLTKHKLAVRSVGCTTKVSPVLLRHWSSGVRLPGTIGLVGRTGLRKVGLAGLLGEPELASFGQVTFDYVNRRIGLGFPPPAGSEPAPAPSRSTRLMAFPR
jgi:predicted aspartyl protease